MNGSDEASEDRISRLCASLARTTSNLDLETEQDEEMAVLFASQAAVAIANARAKSGASSRRRACR